MRRYWNGVGKLLLARSSETLLLLSSLIHLFSLLWFLQSNDIRQYNSDYLYIPTLFKDIFEWGGHLSEWRLTPAPYFFPDMAIYFPVAALLSNWHLALTISLTLQLTLFTLGWCLIGRSFLEGREPRLHYASFVLAVISVLLVMPGTSGIIRPQLTISNHFGVILLLPFTLWLVFRFLKPHHTARQKGFIALGLVILFAFLGVSDAVAYAHLILPLLLASAFLVAIKNARASDAFKLGSCAVVGAGITLLLKSWLIRFPQYAAAWQSTDLFERIGHSLTAALVTTKTYWQGSARIIVLLFLLSLAIHGVITLAAIRYAADRRESNVNIVFLSVITLNSFLLALIAAVGSGFFIDRTGLRYLHPLVVLPVYSMLPVAFLFASRVGLARITTIAFIGFALIRQLASNDSTESLSRYTDQYPQIASCIDAETSKRGIQSGVGTYYDAKYLTVLSKSNIRISQIYRDFSPDIWISNAAWYSRFRPKFVLYDPIADNLDMAWLINTYGYPNEVVDCQSRELWLYDRPEDQFFQTLFADHPALVDWCQPDAAAKIPGYVWRGDVGVNHGTSIAAPHQQGLVSTGRLAYHPAGSYELAINYAVAEANGLQIVGEVRVGHSSILHKEPEIEWRAFPLSVEQTSERIVVDLDTDSHLTIEVRSNGHGIFTLHSFHLRKISTDSSTRIC